MTGHSHSAPQASVDDRIKLAALTLAMERGLTSVGMSDVATHAGVTRQTVYSRYKDIDTIIVSALGDHHATSIDQLRSLLGTTTTTADRIGILVRQIVATTAHGSDLAQFHLGLSPDARVIIDRHDDDIREIITEVIVAGIELGDVAPDLDPEAAAVIVREMLTGGAIVARETQDPATAVAVTVSLILKAIDAQT